MNNEKAFKTMGLAGAADIAIGIVMVVAGLQPVLLPSSTGHA